MKKSEAIYRGRKTLILNNFLGGIAWGVGTVLGATVVVALVGYLLSSLQTIPFLGGIVENISRQFGDK